MSSQLPVDREREIAQKVAPFKECYKLYALMQVLMNKGIVKKEEIEEEYSKVASSMLQYFEDEGEKMEVMRFIL